MQLIKNEEIKVSVQKAMMQRNFHFIISVITFSDSRAPLTQICVTEIGTDTNEL